MTNKKMARSFSPNAASKIGPAVDEIFAENLDRLQRRAGTEDHRHENGRLQRVEHQRIDIQFGDIAEDLAAERLPMGERVGGDADQGSEPENRCY